jgi:hypothetical protein
MMLNQIEIKIDGAVHHATEDSLWLLKKNASLFGLMKLFEEESQLRAPKVRNFV